MRRSIHIVELFAVLLCPTWAQNTSQEQMLHIVFNGKGTSTETFTSVLNAQDVYTAQEEWHGAWDVPIPDIQAGDPERAKSVECGQAACGRNCKVPVAEGAVRIRLLPRAARP